MSQLYFSRDVKVYVQTGTAIWEVPVLDGFSFSQATNSVEVTLNEMSGVGGASRRGRKLFNDSLAPAEWSFQTYARPFTSVGTTNPVTPGIADTTAGNHHAVEEVLWALAAGPAVYATNTFTFNNLASTPAAYTVTDGDDLNISFAESNLSQLGTATIWFHFPADGATYPVIYKISGCCVNEATLTFDIDGIATIDWSGMGTKIEDVPFTDLTTALAVNLINEGTSCDYTGNFIRNRISTMTLVADDIVTFPGKLDTSNPPVGDGTYSVVLTGGSITISNNITFLTPSTLGCVNVPLGHVTGTRTVSGTIDCYLDGEESFGSGQLFDDLISATSLPTNKFTLDLFVGGTAGPAIQFNLPQAHLEVPAHDIGDIISLSTTFHGLPSSIGSADELNIIYKGA